MVPYDDDDDDDELAVELVVVLCDVDNVADEINVGMEVIVVVLVEVEAG